MQMDVLGVQPTGDHGDAAGGELRIFLGGFETDPHRQFRANVVISLHSIDKWI